MLGATAVDRWKHLANSHLGRVAAVVAVVVVFDFFVILLID